MQIDDWIKKKIGQTDTGVLSRGKLEKYQLEKLQETLQFVKEKSKFYESHLEAIDPVTEITSLNDLFKIPFTTPDLLKEYGSAMVCVSQSNISRIVTLDTSGSSGNPKRIYFTEEDQELTIDYFHFGMQVMTNPNDTFMILLPCRTPGSVGDLLRIGLERDGIKVLPYGFPDPDESKDNEIIGILKEERVTSLVGTAPVIARLAQKSAGILETIRTVLLSAEYISPENVRVIEDSWKSEIFEHFGMTETGLGGAMACIAHEGYHPREADLLFEIVDPDTGEILPDGEFGELVFTTLTRVGMPLIRYRTGDITRWIPEECSCGSRLRRLDKVGDRGIPKVQIDRKSE